MKPRIVISAPSSGTGKTTVTLALLMALKSRGVTAFKCGPDYIDPMFHRRAAGIPSRNLDPWFLGEEGLRRLFLKYAGAYSVIEGAMGYYDGIGPEGKASTYEAARALKAPVLLVLSAKGMQTSAAALYKGFSEFRPESGIAGVILNNCSERRFSQLRDVLAHYGIRCYGYLPPCPELSVESRHLGLYTAAEVKDLGEKLEKLGELAESCLDLPGILSLMESAPELPGEEDECPAALAKDGALPPARDGSCGGDTGPLIAVSMDDAFCFLYEENLELLRALGARIAFFSPLKDDALPVGTSGLYICGGYPELHKEELSGNSGMLESIRGAVKRGMPAVFECGGYMYAHGSIDSVPMLGILPGNVYKGDRLQHFGYTELAAPTDSLLFAAGQHMRCHEFHYYISGRPDSGLLARKASGGEERPCCAVSESLYAGFPHLYFPGSPESAERFVKAAARFAAGKG